MLAHSLKKLVLPCSILNLLAPTVVQTVPQTTPLTETLLSGFLSRLLTPDPRRLTQIYIQTKSVEKSDVRIDLKLCYIGPKRNKSGTFSDEISVHFGS